MPSVTLLSAIGLLPAGAAAQYTGGERLFCQRCGGDAAGRKDKTLGDEYVSSGR
ncbi:MULTISPECIES: hypothetical protein [unclassified Chelatococcus]|uniref:hypothetical protein n=1 Tax=unclassified Chelatococcus TaxID=2638111 RepID=UPI001BCF43A2|nr:MULTISPECIES: hypothetical protein [unclassified Chelatococcus]MBS7697469.1 hypothetical protein [Chelatococcus sp. YT9]MBX3560033.1 hypothetical protein [Chelatococcus sp.]